jgi:hypothetical protein
MSSNPTPEQQKRIDALEKSVVQQLAKGTKADAIVEQLVNKGLNKDIAVSVVRNAAYSMQAGELTPAGRTVSASKHQGRMIRGGLICLVGLAVTIGTLLMAQEGGRYVIAWGAVIFGGFDFLAGLVGWMQHR